MATRRQITQVNKQTPRSAWNDGPWNEIAGLVLLGIGVVVMLSLASYSSSDPSWNSTGKYERARNWIGPTGANIADLLFQTFGLAAMVVPFIFGLAGWWQWKDDRPPVPKSKAFGIFLILVSLTGVLSMLGSDTPGDFYLGGFVGKWLVYGSGVGLEHFLGSIGAIVALLLLFIGGLVLGTQFSIANTLIRFSTPEQMRQPGFLYSVGNRFRAWRANSDNLQDKDQKQGQKQEKPPDQLREPVRRPNFVPAKAQPLINVRENTEEVETAVLDTADHSINT